MRDLSNIPVATTPVPAARRILKLIIFIALILVVFYLAKSRFSGGETDGGDIILREAPRGLTPVVLKGNLVDVDTSGVDLVTESATLTDVKYGGEAKASATRSYGAGIYKLTVAATLPDPKNVDYQVWLVSGENVLPIDYMRGSGTNWSLSLRGQDKYSGYREIWITLERTKDELPEEHVMEGSF